MTASGCPLLGQVHLSEWHLLAFFPGFPFVPLICRSFRSKFCCFCRLTGALRPEPCVLSFEDTTQGSLHLVAQFVGTTALARLEPQSPPACLYPARATPTPRSEPVVSHHHFATHRGGDPLPCAARALAPLVGRAARSQCSRMLCSQCGYYPVRSAWRVCCLSRSLNRLRDEHGSAEAWGLRGCPALAQLVWQTGLVRGHAPV